MLAEALAQRSILRHNVVPSLNRAEMNPSPLIRFTKLKKKNGIKCLEDGERQYLNLREIVFSIADSAAFFPLFPLCSDVAGFFFPQSRVTTTTTTTTGTVKHTRVGIHIVVVCR